MDVLTLLAGNALTWMAGYALVVLSAGRERAMPRAWVAGCAWFVGAFATTLWMRALSIAGIPFSVTAVGAPLLACAVAGVVVQRRRARTTAREAMGEIVSALLGRGLAGGHRVLWLAVLAWLAFRFALLLAEVAWRPLFPWDAWTQWGTKAKVWFELRSMVPFVMREDWLQPGTVGYVDAGPHYPATVPLLQVWSALLVGEWNDVLVNLPWWIAGVALALALYGFFAGEGLGALPSLVCTWLVVSMPILNVHVALAGYADLWMAAFLTLGVLAGMRWGLRRQRGDAFVAIVLLVACATIKNPGKAWLLVLVPGALAAIVPRVGVRLAVASLAAAMLALVAFARFNPTILGYQLHLDYVPPWSGLSDAWFTFANWHLLWFGAIGAVVLGWRHALDEDMAPLTFVVISGLLFLFFGFAFTNAAQWVADQSTVNRATLHLAPLVAVWALLLFCRWGGALQSRPPATQPSAT